LKKVRTALNVEKGMELLRQALEPRSQNQ
jgi:hypothetical protein